MAFAAMWRAVAAAPMCASAALAQPSSRRPMSLPSIWTPDALLPTTLTASLQSAHACSKVRFWTGLTTRASAWRLPEASCATASHKCMPVRIRAHRWRASVARAMVAPLRLRCSSEVSRRA